MRRPFSLLLSLALAGCDSVNVEELQIVGTWEIGELLTERVASLEPDPYGLSLPLDIDLRGDTIAVLDAGNDRVVLFDRDLQPLLAFGRAGDGPGEFNSPVAVQEIGNLYLVFDPASQRLSRFDADGSYLGSTHVPASGTAQTFAVGSDGAVYIPHPWSGHLLTRVDTEGKAHPFGIRPDSAILHPMGVSLDQVVVSAGDTLHVLDWQRRLYRIAPSGELLSARMLPSTFVARAEQQRAAFEGWLGGRSSVAGTAPELAITPSGDLLISDSDGAGSIGLIVDPHSYETEAIRTSERGALRVLSRAALRDSTLFTLTMDGIRIYRIRPSPE